MRRLLLALVAFVLLAPLPPTRRREWHDGEIESSTVTNCNFFPEKGINNLAQFQADKAALPKVGDTFYVRMLPARSGNGCGIAMHIHPEIVLPVGVELAISRGRRRCAACRGTTWPTSRRRSDGLPADAADRRLRPVVRPGDRRAGRSRGRSRTCAGS